MADVNGDRNKETREMALGRRSCSHSSTGPQPVPCANQKHLGALRFLFLVSHQPRITLYSLPLNPLDLMQSTLVLPESRHCVTQQKTGLRPLGGSPVLGDAEKQYEPGTYAAEDTTFSRAVEWPRVIIPATVGPISCHCAEGRQNDSVMLVYWQVDCAIVLTGRSATDSMKDRQATFCSIRKTNAWHYIEDRQGYTIVLGTPSINIVLGETTLPHCTEDKEINNVSFSLTDGPTAWHRANQWNSPSVLNWGMASTTHHAVE